MTTELIDNIRAKFDLASVRKEAKQLRRAEDWEKSRDIRNRYSRETRHVKQTYYREYDTRVKQATKRLIDKAGAKNKAFTYKRFMHDGFGRAQINEQAHKAVHQDHQKRLLRLEQGEAKELGDLLDQVKQRDGLRERTQGDFFNAVDRRSIAERRKPSGPER